MAPVSYTHLDVYKRQVLAIPIGFLFSQFVSLVIVNLLGIPKTLFISLNFVSIGPVSYTHLDVYKRQLTVFENLEALYICRNVITVYPDCKSMIDVARQKLMNDSTFKHLSEDCPEYYFDFEAYASHLQEHGKFLVTEHGIFELPE